MVTLHQLAEMAGISIMSVSRALRDMPGVSSETRTRIKALADQYHYRPNMRAHGQLSGSSRLLGCILPSTTNSHFGRILRGVMQQALYEGYQVIGVEAHTDMQAMCAALYNLIDHRVDAVLLASVSADPLPSKLLLTLRSHNIALVSLDSTIVAQPVDEVMLDEEQLADAAVQYLVSLGHRRVGYFGVDQACGRFGRVAALHRSFQRYGLSQDWFVCHHLTTPFAFIETTMRCATAYHQLVQQTFLDLMRSLTPPTALIVTDEEAATVVHQTASQYSIAVPQQCSLLSYADFHWAPLLSPPLTTMDLHPEEIGRQGVASAIARRQAYDDDTSLQKATIKVAGTVIPRATCAPPPE
jgi:DNA-binding LacI/PurR family transcriptional regulator